MRSLISFLLLAFTLVTGGLHAAGPDEPIYLTVNAQTLSGGVLAGVPFKMVQDGKVLGEMKTTIGGSVRFTVPKSTDWQKAEVVLADDAWKALPAMKRLNPAGTTWFHTFRLYPTNIAKLDTQDRADYIQALPEIWSARRAASGPLGLTPGNMTVAHMTAFLEGSRVEQVSTADQTTTSPLAAHSSAATTVIDAQGQTMGYRRVLLFAIKEGTADILVAKARRTDARGGVLFSGLTPGAPYRIEVPSDGDGRIGRSPVFVANAAGKDAKILQLAPVAVRPASTRLSGIATLRDEPLAGVEILLAGDVRLSTRTDRFGYFDLSPIPSEGDSAVLVRLPGNPRPQPLPLVPGRSEVIVPLDFLAPVK